MISARIKIVVLLAVLASAMLLLVGEAWQVYITHQTLPAVEQETGLLDINRAIVLWRDRGAFSLGDVSYLAQISSQETPAGAVYTLQIRNASGSQTSPSTRSAIEALNGVVIASEVATVETAETTIAAKDSVPEERIEALASFISPLYGPVSIESLGDNGQYDIVITIGSPL